MKDVACKLTWIVLLAPALVSTVSVLGACTSCSRGNRDDDLNKVSTTTTTSAMVAVTNQEAITVLMEARCTRAAECRTSPPGVTTVLQVGVGASHEECLATVGPGLRARLGSAPCPSGVDGAALEKCLQDLKTQVCMDPPTADSVDGFISCRSAALCPGALIDRP
jgi:hypothetical protein